MSNKTRKPYTAEEKVAILRRHLLDHVPVSDLCDEYHFHPTQFYRWQRQFFENGTAAFAGYVTVSHDGLGTPDGGPGGEVGAPARGALRADGGVCASKKSAWGALTGRWVPLAIRDQLVDFIHYWAPRGEWPVTRLLAWLGLGRSQWATWKARYGRVNEHNAWIPRDFWLEDWEKAAIIACYQGHPLEGYRRLTYLMLDADIVAVSPASVYRVLKQAGLRRAWAAKPSKKGRGFHQPETAHPHWHVDIAYLNVAGTCFFLCSVLDGFSRFIVHWEIRPQMTEADVEIILQRAREAFPEARPRIISDNGPPFIAREFKEFIRIAGMTHGRTSPFYPQSNGKLERWHQSLKSEAIRPKTPLCLADAQRVVGEYVTHYNYAS